MISIKRMSLDIKLNVCWMPPLSKWKIEIKKINRNTHISCKYEQKKAGK